MQKKHRHPEGRPARLRKHIAVVLLVKTAVLFGLWHSFVKPHRVRIDVEQAAVRIAGPSIQINQGE